MRGLVILLVLLISSSLRAQSLEIGESTILENGNKLQLLGVQEGTLIKYIQLDDEGNTRQEGTYLDGKPHGTWTLYLANGEKTTMKFHHGIRIVLNTIDEKGRRVEIYYADNKPTRAIYHLE